MRNQEWLENRFEYIYRKYFADLEAPNRIDIKWGRRSRRQLGCIKKGGLLPSLRGGDPSLHSGQAPQSLGSRLPRPFGSRNDKFTTIIVINGLFKDEAIPLFVIDAVIAHEMSHYAHGFNSPLPQQHRHPHKGGIIRKELKKRDLSALEHQQKLWTAENWQKYLDQNFPSTRKHKIRYRIIWK